METTHIAGYQVLSEIGRGSTTVVWRVWDHVNGVELAVKELVLPATTTPEARAAHVDRFLYAGRVGAALRHPAVLRVLAADVFEGRPAVVMELAGGETLASWLSRGAFPAQTAIAVTEHVLRALEYAHAHDVAHSNLWPGNVFLDSGGGVKVADFAFSRASRPEYMSPEQIMSGDADRSADIWGAGVTLYELLTGRYPFGEVEGVSSATLMHRIVNDEPAPIDPQVLGSVSAPLDRILPWVLAKDPGERCPDVRSFAAALRSAPEPTPVAAAPEPVPEPAAAPAPVVAPAPAPAPAAAAPEPVAPTQAPVPAPAAAPPEPAVEPAPATPAPEPAPAPESAASPIEIQTAPQSMPGIQMPERRPFPWIVLAIVAVLLVVVGAVVVGVRLMAGGDDPEQPIANRPEDSQPTEDPGTSDPAGAARGIEIIVHTGYTDRLPTTLAKAERDHREGQSFHLSEGHSLLGIRFKMSNAGPAQTIVCDLWPAENGLPTGQQVAQSTAEVPVSDLTDVSFGFQNVELAAGDYVAVIRAKDGETTGVSLYQNDEDPYGDGARAVYDGAGWQSVAGKDLCFAVKVRQK